MIKPTVDGRAVELNEVATLPDTAKEAGVHASTLCHHSRLPSHAACRMCFVDVEGRDRSRPAFITLARDGDAVATDSKALQDFRSNDAECCWHGLGVEEPSFERAEQRVTALGFDPRSR